MERVILDSVMMQRMHEFLTHENGQDLIEYSLLLAFVMFTIIGLVAGMGGSIAGIAGVSSSQVSYANSMVS